MARRVTLIQCTAPKREGTHPAKDLYDKSRYFRAMRDWAKAKPQPWFILSAKHGLVWPNEPISDYDERGLSESLAERIAEELNDIAVHTADVTAGRDYTNPLTPELERRGIDVVEHFAGKRIGEREKLLREATPTA